MAHSLFIDRIAPVPLQIFEALLHFRPPRSFCSVPLWPNGPRLKALPFPNRTYKSGLGLSSDHWSHCHQSPAPLLVSLSFFFDRFVHVLHFLPQVFSGKVFTSDAHPLPSYPSPSGKLLCLLKLPSVKTALSQ